MRNRWNNLILPARIGIFAGIAVLIVFSPLVSGLVNLGTYIGMGIGAVFFLASVFSPELARLVRMLRKNTPGRCALIAAALLLLLTVSLAAVCMTGMILRAAGYAPPEDVPVIVLGARVGGKALDERIDAAYVYLSAHPDVPCILSGGKGADEPISEGEAMAKELIGRGIDPSRLYIEDGSTNTYENLRNSAALMRENGLGSEAAIVTHSYHQYRASMMARDAGITAYTVNASVGKSIWTYPTYFLRDMCGVAYRLVFGGR